MSELNQAIDEAIIVSGKCVGHWDENLSKGVRNGTVTRLLLDLSSLKELLTQLLQSKQIEAALKEHKHFDDWIYDPQIGVSTIQEWSEMRTKYLKRKAKALSTQQKETTKQ